MKWLTLVAAVASTSVFAQGEMVELYPNAYISNGHCSIVTDNPEIRGDLTLHGEVKDKQYFKVKRKIILNDHADKKEVYAYMSDYKIKYEDFESTSDSVNARDAELWINNKKVKLNKKTKGQATNSVSMNMKRGWDGRDSKANSYLTNTVELEIDCGKKVVMEVCDLAFSYFPNKDMETSEYRADRQRLLNIGKIGNTRVFKVYYGGYWCPDTFEPDTDSPF